MRCLLEDDAQAELYQHYTADTLGMILNVLIGGKDGYQYPIYTDMVKPKKEDHLTGPEIVARVLGKG